MALKVLVRGVSGVVREVVLKPGQTLALQPGEQLLIPREWVRETTSTEIALANPDDPTGETWRIQIPGGTEAAGGSNVTLDFIAEPDASLSTAPPPVAGEEDPGFAIAPAYLVLGGLAGVGLIVGLSSGSGGGGSKNAAPILDGGDSAAFTVTENAQVVATLTATDAQSGSNLRYSIVGGADAARFTIDATTGVLQFVSAPDFEGRADADGDNVYDVIVQVSDGSLTDTQSIRVTVANTNEAPVLADQNFSVAENAEAGSVIGTVVSADVDAGDTRSFAITGGNTGGAFAIDALTGEIRVANAAAMDFESQSLFTLVVGITDGGGLSDSATVTIQLTNVNEAPVFDDQRFTVSESTAPGTTIGSVFGIDPDTGDTLTFSLLEDNAGGAFALDPMTGSIRLIDVSLIDFETATNLSLTVKITDAAGLSDTAVVTLDIGAENEAPTLDDRSLNVDENTSAGTSIGRLIARDPDLGDTQSYSLLGGSGAGLFTIEADTGEIRIATGVSLDFEALSSYSLQVGVTDAEGLSDTATITIDINDVNEAPTLVSYGGVDSLQLQAAEGYEQPVGVFTATDPDAGSLLRYSIVGGPDRDQFSIDEQTGELRFNTALDFERPADADRDNQYDLVVQVSDGHLTDTQAVRLIVTNLNEAPVIISDGGDAAAAITVQENTTAVTVVAALDPEGDSLSYRIIGGADAARFVIDSVTGALRFVAAPDVEQPLDAGGDNVYDVIVETSDGSLTDSQSLAVTVTNQNEAPVVEDQSLTTPENRMAGTVIGTVVSSDPDAGDTRSYSLIGGNTNGAFAIDAVTGELRVANAAALNFEATPSFTLTVGVTDAGSLSDTATVTVTLTNVNEAPVIDDQSFTASENRADGTVVGTVASSDPDASDTRSYSLLGGNTNGAFAIDAVTGELRVANAAALNFETTPSFTLTVGVTDAGSLSDTATVTVTLTNVNEAPVIEDAARSVAENSSVGTLVGASILSSDPDAGDTRSYSIIGGNTNGAFAIDAQTGQLRVATPGALDFETTPSFTLTVGITDAGGLSDTATVTVTLTNVNEAPVIEDAARSVAENSSVGTLVGASILSSDPDAGDTRSYSIIGGNTNGAFAIDAQTGQLRVATPGALDFETTPSFTLTLGVTDAGGLSDTATVTVQLANINEAPVITSNGGGNTASVSVAENSSAVTTVVATDVDAGATLTYSLAGGVDQARFAINSSTGALSFIAPPDFESPTDSGSNNIYDVIVRVSDGTLTDTQSLSITVTDVNENLNAPVITSNGGGDSAAISIAENGTAVATVVATDADLVGTLTYSLAGGADQARFAINSSTGALRFIAPPDFENPTDIGTNSVYDVIVRVSDGLFSDTQALAVTVTNVNDNAPVITSNGGGNTASVSVAENSGAVTTVTATDPDVPSTLTYSLIGGADQARFAINSSTGALSFIAPPNFESPTDSGGNNVYDVVVQVSDGSLTDSQAIAVTVTNLNDNTPVITSNGGGDSAAISIAENTTTVTTVVATDADVGATLTYSLIGGADQARFAINSSTGALSFIAPPDFENPTDNGANNVYNVIVQVSDGTFSDTQALAITITDATDNAPVITSNGGGDSAAISFSENGTGLLTTVAATDADVGAALAYSLAGGADQARFSINASTGALSFIAPPDFETPTDNGTNNVYNVIVRVSDGTFSDTQALAVTVTNVNEAPVITSNGGGNTASVSVAENSSAVTTVTATDPDVPSTLTYSLIGGADQARFAINSSTGALTFVTAPNFESPTDSGGNNIYDVVVQVSDGSLTDSQALAVTVTNVNEAPVITSNGGGNTASVSVAENGSAVTAVTATDPDVPSTLTYSLIGGADQARFAINSSTGALSFIAPPNFESPTDSGGNNVYDVVVQVSDGSLTDSQALAVTVTNLNDNTPVITSNGGGDSAAISIAENTTTVTTVVATDADVGATLTYSLIGGADQARFAINSSTGALSFIAPPDFENPTDSGTNNVYNVVVQVSDGTFSDTQALAITITDATDNAPVITSNGGGDSAAISFSENATGLLTTLIATDADAGSTLTYSLIGGADQARFAINSSTGALSFIAPPDFESPTDSGGNNIYDVIVRVSDGTFSDTQAIAVTVTNVNETPVINSNGGGNTASVSVAENSSAVTTVMATDPDVPSTLTYSLIGGADQARFAINSSTGALSFIAPPNFESPTDSGGNNIYDVVVQVSDGSLTDSQALAVTVTNVNEAPVITSNGGGNTASVSVAENSSAVTTVMATDPDVPSTLTYSLIGGADQARFAINSSTGALSFIAPPNFESPTDSGGNNIYDVVVQVSDGSLTDTQAIAVTVTNVNETPVITSDGGGNTASVSVAENSSAVTTVTATDPDVPSTLTYSLIGGADQGFFSINSSTGALSFIAPPSFEVRSDSGADNIYNVTVQVSDGSLTDSQAIAVTVTNVNEAPMITSNGGGNTASVSVAENSGAVTTVTATDPDVPSTLTYSLIGGADQARFAINSSTGALTFVTPPNFESPTDSGGNNVYDVVVQVSDGSLTDSQALAVTVTNVNDNAPVITSNGGGDTASVSVAENTTAVTMVVATDVDGPSLSYSLVAGGDAALFSINSSTGALSFNTAPDFEMPADGNGDNAYNVTVRVSDGNLSDTQTITVTVTDVNEAISVIQLSSLNGTNGFRLDGVTTGDLSGNSVASAGDVNGDGYDDLIVGASQADPNGANSGSSYVVFGRASGFASSINLSTLDGSTGFRLDGVTTGDSSGFSVASAGDVNGDGYDDLIVGADRTDINGLDSGSGYVVFGRASGFAPTFNLSALDGTTGFRLDGVAADDRGGRLLASAGDVNGDGYDDLVIAAPNADPNGVFSGSSYLLFGQASGFASSINLSTLNGSIGFRLDGVDVYDGSGSSVSSAGDINGDGFDDLIVGAWTAGSNVYASGSSYVVFGRASGFASNINLSTLDGDIGFRLDGVNLNDRSGLSVSGAGDVNGDGYDDLIVGAFQADPNGGNSGSSYVVFGRASGFASSINLSTLDGSTGFRLDGMTAGDQSGRSVASAGDVNGDGYDDLIVGAFQADPNGGNSGSSYVVFGRASGFASSINLSTLDGSSGFRLDGVTAGDYSGISVASAGDVNGDGYDDLFIGAEGADPNGVQDAGSSYVVYGFATTGGNIDVVGSSADNTTTLTALQKGVDGGAGNDSLTGNASANTLIGGQGNDTLNGAGGNDVLIGGVGNDVLVYDAADTLRVDGGTGRDTLRIDGSGVNLNLTALNNFSTPATAPANPYSNIEIVNLTGSGNNTLTLNAADLLRLVDAAGPQADRQQNLLRVDGNAGDAVVAAGIWLNQGARDADGNAGTGYTLYTSGTAQLLVQNGVSQAGITQNQAPVITSNGGGDTASVSVAENTTAVTTVIATDVDGPSLSYSLVAGGDAARFSINSSTGALSFNTAPNFEAPTDGNGDNAYNVTVRVSDGNLSDTQAITVTVTDVNEAISVLALSSLNGSNGFQINGESANDFAGRSVSSAGDVNGDGYDDLLVGSTRANANGTASGASYVVFGRASGFSSAVELSSLSGTDGFQINGEAAAHYAGVVASAGDVNGDGYDDLLIAASGVDVNGINSGAAYVVFGKASGFASVMNLSSLTGSNGFQINGEALGDQLGSVAGAGDLNGDGYDDLLIGAQFSDVGGVDSGVSYVVFGRNGGFSSELNLSSLDGVNGFQINFQGADGRFGRSISSAGDVNGDGFDDVIIGSDRADVNGASFIVFGRNGGFGSVLEVSALDGITGFKIVGAEAGDQAGSVASAGDVNGDGYDDLIIGADGASPNTPYSGASYVVFGRATGFGSAINLSTLNGSTGFRLNGIDNGDLIGYSVSAAGDVNGDGYADVLVGAAEGDPSGLSSGESYVVFGRASGFASAINLSSLDGTNGFVINGQAAGDRSGSVVSAAGDVNGDGFDDLIVGAGQLDPGGRIEAGGAHVIFGFATTGGNIDVVGSSADNTTTLTALQKGVDGGAGNDSLTGNASANTLIGGQGNDTLNGAGGNDVLIGGVGNDVLVYDAADTLRVDGGTGRDTLRIDGSGVNLNLTALNNFSTPATAPANPYSNIEIVNLTGSGNNTLTLNAADLLRLVDAAGPQADRQQNLLRVDGNAGDAVVAAGIWLNQGARDADGNAGTGYTLYTSGTAQLLVQNGVDQSAITTPIAVLQTSALNGSNGFQINGEVANGRSGWSTSSAGDINGDGYDDVLIGAPFAAPNNASYVVFGSAGGIPGTLELSNLNGSNGFQINGERLLDQGGESVSSAGDINGDGYDDLIIGANAANPNGAVSGAGFVVFGRASGFASTFELSSLNGLNGFQINGERAGDQAGSSVSLAGDVNGDGYDDFIIGATAADPNGNTDFGATYLVFGQAGGFASNFELSALNGSNGFRLNGAQPGATGSRVANAGDVNGDGYDDLIVGAYLADLPGKSDAGASYVVFGQSGGFPREIPLSSLNGSNGFQISGESIGDNSANSVASAGDVNGDGYDDLIVGARLADVSGTSSGASYVIFGAATGFSSVLELSSLNGTNGFRINGEAGADASGDRVHGGGDFNGDGLDDLIVAARGADLNGVNSGGMYVIFGQEQGFGSAFNLASLNGANGIKIVGSEAFQALGSSASFAGDVNGDGFDDLITSAANFSPNGLYLAGTTYVIYGFATTGGNIDVVGSSANDSTTLTSLQKGVDGGAGNDSLTGNASANTLIGGQGNDTLNGAGGNDALIGGVGNDVLVYDAADTLRVDGGTGRDTLRIDDSGVNLNLTALNNFSTPATAPANPYSNIEIINLTGSGNNTLTLNAADLLRLVDAATDGSGGRDQNLLRVDGNAGDAVVTSSGLWANAGARNADGNAGTGYTLYTSGTAQLLVQNGVDQSGIAVPVSSLSMTILNGSNGYRLLGEAAGTNTGHSVSGAGDVNGDGFDDVIIGARYGDSNGSNSGTSYVIYGAAGGMSASQGLGSSGVRITGPAANAGAGWSVSGAGDVNNDGFADIVIGAPFTTLTTPANAFGGSFVVFGGAALPANISLNGLTGSNGFRVTAPAGSFPGRSVSDAGDVNGDGYADVLISAERFAANGLSGSGSAFVVYGRPGAFTADITLTTMNAASGFQIAGELENDQIGRVVSSIGDFNGDGFDDLIVSNEALSRGTTFEIGGNYVVFGGSSLTSSVNLSALNGSNGFRIFGTTAFEQLGASVSGAGDLNGDGFADFIVSQGVNGIGLSYVVFGRSGAMPGTLQLSTLNGSNGFKLTGPTSSVRYEVSGAGDFNGDGYDDLILISDVFASPSFVMFGKAGGFTSNIDLSSLGGATGFRLADTEQAVTASAAGDMNGDGFDDVIIGAPFTGSNSGTAFVVHGFATAGTMSQVGTGGNDTLVAVTADTGLNGGAGNDSLTGNASANTLIGGQGNDTLSGGGGNDVLIGAAGDDLLIYDALDVTRVDGGNGTDTLRLQNGDDINFTLINDLLITGIERIDLETDAGINQLTLAVRDILALSESTNDLFIFGNTGDIVDLSPGFADTGNFSQDGRTYDIYTIAGNDARVYVEQGLSVI